MKIIDAISRLDALKFNTYKQDDKVQWLSRLDSMVKEQIINVHEGADAISFSGYTADTPTDTVLLVPAPWDEIYLLWLEAQIDYHNHEYDSYNNAIVRFNAAFEDYQKHYNSAHKPVQRGRRFLF